MTAKTCRICGETKPINDFYAGQNRCKACTKTKATAYRNANLDKVQAYDRARSKAKPNTEAKRRYKQANRDEINAANRAARAADPEAARAKDRAYYLSNPGARAAATRKWKNANRDRLAAYDAARRARHADAVVSRVDWATVSAAEDCYLCGQQLDADVHIDHVVPLARGGAHCTDNLRPTHATCNLRKSDKLLSELPWYHGSSDLGVALPGIP